MTSPGPHLEVNGNVSAKGEDFTLQNSADAYAVKRLNYKAFWFVLFIPLVKCNIWLTFLLEHGLLMKQTLGDNYTSELPDLASWSISIPGDCKGLFFISLVFIMHEKQHIWIGWQLKVELNISEAGRTFEDIIFIVHGFWWGFYLFNDSISKFNVSFGWCQLSIVNVDDEPVELHGCLEQIREIEVCCYTSCRCLCCGNPFTQRTFSWCIVQLVKERMPLGYLQVSTGKALEFAAKCYFIKLG